MENELTVIEPRTDISMSRAPEVILDEAKRASKALVDVLKNKKKPVIMNGEQYLEFEDWQTLGRFYGVTSKITQTEAVTIGEVTGFLAKAVVVRADGMEISGAEAMCLNDEANWKTKPLFQLRSMAQTRACAKALRNVLAWVVVLAGYKPTPAEEMDGVRPFADKLHDTKVATSDTQVSKVGSSEAQHRAIHAILGKLGVKDEMDKHEKVSNLLKVEPILIHFNQLTVAQASTAIKLLGAELDKKEGK